MESTERKGPYVVHDDTTPTMLYLTCTADVGVRRSLEVSFAPGVLRILKMSIIKIFLALEREVAAK